MAFIKLREWFNAMELPIDIKRGSMKSRELAELHAFKRLEQKICNSYFKKATRSVNSKSPPARKPLVDIEKRRAERKREERSLADAQQLVQKMETNRLEKEQRENLRVMDFFRRQEMQRSKEEQLLQLNQEKKKKEYKEKLQEMHDNALRRKEKLLESNPSLRIETPLYKKLQKKYYDNIELPEINRQKSILAHKRSRKVSMEEILEHAKRYKKLSEEIKRRRNASFQANEIDNKINYGSLPKSSLFTKIKEEEQQKSLEVFAKQDFKRNLILKKKNYSHLVKEMFVPRTKRQPKSMSAQNIPRKENSAQNIPRKENPDTKREHPVIPYRSWKKNNMIPQPPPKKEPIIPTDYLQERRKLREVEPLDSNNPKVKISMMEQKAREIEMKAEYLKNQDPYGVYYTSEVSNMILESIKAKLSLLENNC